MLFIVLRPVGLGVEKNTATSSLKFLLLRGWIWQKFLRFPYTSGDTYAVLKVLSVQVLTELCNILWVYCISDIVHYIDKII